MGSAHLRACSRTWTLCPALLLPLKSHVPFTQDLLLYCFCFLNWFPVFFKQSPLLSSLPAPRITNSSVSSYQSDGEYLPSLQGNTHALGLTSTGMLENACEGTQQRDQCLHASWNWHWHPSECSEELGMRGLHYTLLVCFSCPVTHHWLEQDRCGPTDRVLGRVNCKQTWWKSQHFISSALTMGFLSWSKTLQSDPLVANNLWYTHLYLAQEPSVLATPGLCSWT